MEGPGEKLNLEKFRENLKGVRQRIAEAAARAGKSPESVRLMAVTKTFPQSHIEIAFQAGITLFGENRVQEALGKYPEVMEGNGDVTTYRRSGPHWGDLELHLVGHLQRNKAGKAARIFSCVQSIDKLETVQALDHYCLGCGRKMNILLEMNTSGEESKFGFRREDELLSTLEKVLELKGLRLCGLMTVGPFTGEEAKIRKAFAGLNRLFYRLKEKYPELELDTLSMGMSGDFEIAVEEGSTMVRVGTALFGPRN